MKFIIKYKLYHIIFWAFYHFAWWSFYSGKPMSVASDIATTPMAIKYLSYVIFQAIGVYFCLYYLIPNFLKKGKYTNFLLFLSMTILLTAWIIVGGYYLSAALVPADPYEIFKVDPRTPFTFFKKNTLPSSLSVFTLALSIKLAKNWLESQNRTRQIEREKLETELKFLRSQFNPHFLFNTINSVHTLINRNPVMATETLTRFSDLLRYQLYECNEHYISLDKELDYLKSYVDLEEIRLNDNYEINLKAEGTAENLIIAPFVLIPFLENAFKHVSHHSKQVNWINIDIQIKDQTLFLAVSNSTSEKYKSASVDEGDQGIGLPNVQRRLALLYPGAHSLEIIDDDQNYSVFLQLQLSRQANQTLVNS